MNPRRRNRTLTPVRLAFVVFLGVSLSVQTANALGTSPASDFLSSVSRLFSAPASLLAPLFDQPSAASTPTPAPVHAVASSTLVASASTPLPDVARAVSQFLQSAQEATA